MAHCAAAAAARYKRVALRARVYEMWRENAENDKKSAQLNAKAAATEG